MYNITRKEENIFIPNKYNIGYNIDKKASLDRINRINEKIKIMKNNIQE